MMEPTKNELKDRLRVAHDEKEFLLKKLGERNNRIKELEQQLVDIAKWLEEKIKELGA